jgi:hypothetical protein
LAACQIAYRLARHRAITTIGGTFVGTRGSAFVGAFIGGLPDRWPDGLHIGLLVGALVGASSGGFPTGSLVLSALQTSRSLLPLVSSLPDRLLVASPLIAFGGMLVIGLPVSLTISYLFISLVA